MSNRTRLAVFSALATLLASAALGPLFEDLSWLLPVAGAIAVVVGIGELVRRSGLPPSLGPLLAAVGVTGFVTAVFAHEPAVASVIPGPAALERLGVLARQGFADIRVLAPPVPTSAGMVLITVVGVALVALVVDVLAVSLRRAALAGLPLLALFAVPAAVASEGVGWFPFTVGAVGYLGLLLAESRDRLARWGRPLGLGRVATAATPAAVEYAETSPLAAVGRRIGLAALGVAVVVPALVPGLHPGVFGSGGGSGLPVTNGSNTVATYNPIVRLQGELTRAKPQDLLQVTTNDPDPGYLRMVALDVFDGTTWSESPLTVSKDTQIRKSRLPAPDGLTNVASTEIQTKIEVSNLDVHWLPVPYPATSVKVKGWNYDKGTDTIFSTRSKTRRDMTYTVVSRRLTPNPEQLRRAPAAGAALIPFTRLPELPAEILDKVDELTRNQPDAYSKALAMQKFFRTQFTYDVTVPRGNSESDLVNFLDGRRGFCEQFAAAMAVFARQAGIPARVAIGFTRGQRQQDGSWRVTTDDAHSWPELYFEGAGWLRFEPTPLGPGRAVDPGYAASAGGGTGGLGLTEPDPGAAGASRGLNSRNRPHEDEEPTVGDTGPAAVLDAPERSTGLPWQWLLLAAAIVAAVFPTASRAATRRRRWSAATTPAERAHAAWAELKDDAGDFGLPWSASHSPRAAGSQLIRRAGLDGAAAERVRFLVSAEERARYSRQPADAGDLRAAVTAVRSALSTAATPVRRWQGRLVPRSGLRILGTATDALADLLDAVDLAAARIRRRLLRRPAV